MVHEVSHPNEPEKMLQDSTEATEELSRKNDFSEVRDKDTLMETQRKEKSEETQENVEKINKKEARKMMT